RYRALLLSDHRGFGARLLVFFGIERQVSAQIEVNFDDPASEFRQRLVLMGYGRALVAAHVESLIQRIPIGSSAWDLCFPYLLVIDVKAAHAAGAAFLFSCLFELILDGVGTFSQGLGGADVSELRGGEIVAVGYFAVLEIERPAICVSSHDTDRP